MRIAVIGGSLRKDSLNLKLLGHLARSLEGLGAEVATATGEALRLPLYDADLPAPPEATALQTLLASCQGLVLVSPEYNAGIPPHLKNAVDWVSTMAPSPFRGLPILLASASPGAFGGSRALLSWRPVLANLGALVLPAAITVPLADRTLGPDGAPTEARTQGELARTLAVFLDVTSRLGARP